MEISCIKDDKILNYFNCVIRIQKKEKTHCRTKKSLYI